MIKEFSTIRLISNDLQKSKIWYKAFLQIEPQEEMEDFVSFRVAGVNFDIVLPDLKNPFSEGGSIGYWLVDNIDAVIDRVQVMGGEIYRGPLSVIETNRRIVQIKDPCGNVLGFESIGLK